MAYKQLKLWFDAELAAFLADKIIVKYSGLDKYGFIKAVDTGVLSLELKDRIELIADLLDLYINTTFEVKAALFRSILGPENNEETGMFKKYYWIMPIAKWVEKYGLVHPKESLELIAEITKRNTGEYAIRPFIIEHQSMTLEKMHKWAKSENFHLRRLASEGIRIRLPWAKKMPQFVDHPQPLIDIIEILKDDPKKYVQKSVANNLNDLLKENAIAAKAVIKRWNKNSNPNRDWIIKHALRNELKKGSQWAQEIINN